MGLAVPQTKQSVLLISAEFAPQVGGIATFSRNLAVGLQQAGWHVRVLTSVGGSDPAAFGFRVTRSPGILNVKAIKVVALLITAIWMCLNERPAKVVLMKWTHEGVIGWALKKLFKVEFILVTHGGDIRQRHWLLRVFMTWCFSHAAAVVANSQFTRDELLALGLAPEKVTIIHPPVCLDETPNHVVDAEVLAGLSGRRILLTVGRLQKYKGQDQVLRVLGGLKVRYPDLIYVMVGEGEYRQELRALVGRYALTDRVKVLGRVSTTTLARLYRMSEVVVMVSRQEGRDIEGFGISLAEGSLFGKPVIGGDNGGMRDAVIDGETGYLVDSRDPNEIRDRLVLLLENEALRERLGRQGRERALREFTIAHQAELLSVLLKGQTEPENVSTAAVS